MRIKLINSQQHLRESFGIDMQQTGATDRINVELSRVLVWSAWEYDYDGDFMLITADDGTEIPDLSLFGEVVASDDPTW